MGKERKAGGGATRRVGSTSNKVRSVPPVIFHTIPVALSIPISSKGDWMAFKAASLALVFPTQKQAPENEYQYMRAFEHNRTTIYLFPIFWQ